jgi:predicted dehydrogenase
MSHLSKINFRFANLAVLAKLTFFFALTTLVSAKNNFAQPPAPADLPLIKVGIIGLDTSHSIAFTEALNAKNPDPNLTQCRVVAAYPNGSADIKSSVERIPAYTEKIKSLGVEVVDSIDELLKRCDAVLLETNDGRPHLEQLIPCLKAGKRTFVDKPVAGSLSDAIKMFALSKELKVPFFTSSALRFSKTNQSARAGEFGKIKSAWATSPASVEATHPLLYWYGIHGVESLFTLMGPGCEKVTCEKVDGKIVARGVWSDGRVGEFREGSGYVGKVVTDKGEFDVGNFDGYKPLVVEIVRFFRNGEVPVSPEESLEIYAFMSAAEESLKNNGREVSLKTLLMPQ